MDVAANRVLVYRLGSLGDMVVALPALHLVARAFPEAERRLLTNFPVQAKAAPAAALLEGTGTVNGYFRYAKGSRNLLELARLWWEIVRWRPQVLVYLGSARGVESARRDARFFRLCGIKRLVGVPLNRDMQENRWEPGSERLRAVTAPQEDGWFEPEASRLVRNIAELGDAPLDDPASWNLRLTEAERRRADELMGGENDRPAIAVSVGTKLQANDWGRDNWRALLARLAEMYPSYALALVGSADEREASEFAAQGWREAMLKLAKPGAVVNLCGVLTPRQSAAVLARAAVFVGHDSGPVHLAAAVKTPCVAIFSARNKPRVWFPYGDRHRVLYRRVDCWGCGLETCIVEQKKCLTSITVQEVAVEVRRLLKPPP
jgi:ADP-heptose:LPS heptosyltransferase